jgi:hypothetical protein
MSKSTRVTNVQVPGATPTTEQPGNDQATTADTGATQAGAASTADTQTASSSSGKPETVAQATITGASDVFDIEALRAQIRAEEQSRARAELASQIQAASTMIEAGGTATAAAAPRTRADYKTMRADQVDPTTLTAPVMTLDGWVCPVPPEKK